MRAATPKLLNFFFNFYTWSSETPGNQAEQKHTFVVGIFTIELLLFSDFTTLVINLFSCFQGSRKYSVTEFERCFRNRFSSSCYPGTVCKCFQCFDNPKQPCVVKVKRSSFRHQRKMRLKVRDLEEYYVIDFWTTSNSCIKELVNLWLVVISVLFSMVFVTVH